MQYYAVNFLKRNSQKKINKTIKRKRNSPDTDMDMSLKRIIKGKNQDTEQCTEHTTICVKVVKTNKQTNTHSSTYA